MKFYVHFVLVVLGTELFTFLLGAAPHTNIVHITQAEEPGGKWTTRTEWKVHWLKEWIPKKIYVPIWKKVWTPVELREWIPFPKPHPGWHPH